jgi:Cu(I)/Ag(I) efflux system protein CusF
MNRPARAEIRHRLPRLAAAATTLSVLALACTLAPNALAQDAHAAHATHAPAPAPTALIAGKGIVKKIDTSAQRLILAHEPIEQLNWPAMTMPFTVADAALLKGIKTGDVVRFRLNDEQIIVSIGPDGKGQ